MNNPPENCLPKSVPLEKVEEALKSSGYPLQTEVAVQLLPDFYVSEEWGYLDRTTEEPRSLDILASRRNVDSPGNSRIIPELSLPIECKKSTLPYIFFKSATRTRSKAFPIVSGLPGRGQLTLHAANQTKTFSVIDCLGLSDEPFLEKSVPLCTTFSRYESKKGNDPNPTLSGSDPYNHTLLPLISATEYFRLLVAPRNAQDVYHPHLIVPVCIIDAPMMLADASNASPSLTLTPWVRIMRQEAKNKEKAFRSSHQEYAVDIVHRAFLKSYTYEHVLPFANLFNERILLKQTFILSTKKTVPNLDNWKWEDL